MHVFIRKQSTASWQIWRMTWRDNMISYNSTCVIIIYSRLKFRHRSAQRYNIALLKILALNYRIVEFSERDFALILLRSRVRRRVYTAHKYCSYICIITIVSKHYHHCFGFSPCHTERSIVGCNRHYTIRPAVNLRMISNDYRACT